MTKLEEIENKIELVKMELEKWGWKYVVDEFTKSDYGHQRERFEREDTFIKEWLNKEENDVVLIYHYKKDDGNFEKPKIQTYSNVPKSNTKFLETYHKNCCCLQFEEMELFYKFMKLLRKKDLEVLKQCQS